MFGLVWKVWLYRRHSKRNQLIKIIMTITTVLHSLLYDNYNYYSDKHLKLEKIIFTIITITTVLHSRAASFAWFTYLKASSLQYMVKGGLPLEYDSGISYCFHPISRKSILASALIVANLPSKVTHIISLPPTLIGLTKDKGVDGLPRAIYMEN